jgi:hypothetical protein
VFAPVRDIVCHRDAPRVDDIPGGGGELTPLRLDVGVATDERILVERLQRGNGGRQPAEAVEVRSVDAVDKADRRGSPGKGVCTGGRLVLQP